MVMVQRHVVRLAISRDAFVFIQCGLEARRNVGAFQGEVVLSSEVLRSPHPLLQEVVDTRPLVAIEHGHFALAAPAPKNLHCLSIPKPHPHPGLRERESDDSRTLHPLPYHPHMSENEPATTTPTTFGRILDGEIPCHRVYEDEHVLAFLDVGPLSAGHTLIIPKERKAHLHELSDEAAAAIGRVLPRICRAVTKATGATAYNVLQNNGAEAHQAVLHVHFHVIPKYDEAKSDDGSGLGIVWKPGELDGDAAAELREQIAAHL